ncbi:MAG: cyclase family protein [Anaerolineales bacterium]|jgi:arylformamidase
MKIYDISLPVSHELPTWPSDPRAQIFRVGDKNNGEDFNVSHLSMSLHTGTHVDAPFHIYSDGNTVDQLPIKSLNGRAYVVHLPDVELITSDILAKTSIPLRTRRVLFKTENSNYWSRGETKFHKDYVAISMDGARFLVERGIMLVGIDYLSIAPFDQPLPTHEIFLRSGVIILEGLDLSEVPQGRYTLHCLPLKIIGVDGSPARAYLIGV